MNVRRQYLWRNDKSRNSIRLRVISIMLQSNVRHVLHEDARIRANSQQTYARSVYLCASPSFVTQIYSEPFAAGVAETLSRYTMQFAGHSDGENVQFRFVLVGNAVLLAPRSTLVFS